MFQNSVLRLLSTHLLGLGLGVCRLGNTLVLGACTSASRISLAAIVAPWVVASVIAAASSGLLLLLLNEAVVVLSGLSIVLVVSAPLTSLTSGSVFATTASIATVIVLLDILRFLEGLFNSGALLSSWLSLFGLLLNGSRLLFLCLSNDFLNFLLGLRLLLNFRLSLGLFGLLFCFLWLREILRNFLESFVHNFLNIFLIQDGHCACEILSPCNEFSLGELSGDLALANLLYLGNDSLQDVLNLLIELDKLAFGSHKHTQAFGEVLKGLFSVEFRLGRLLGFSILLPGVVGVRLNVQLNQLLDLFDVGLNLGLSGKHLLLSVSGLNIALFDLLFGGNNLVQFLLLVAQLFAVS